MNIGLAAATGLRCDSCNSAATRIIITEMSDINLCDECLAALAEFLPRKGDELDAIERAK